MTFSPLQNRLLPAVSSLSSIEVSLALFPLRESFVAKYVVPHKRFERRILEDVLANYDVDLSQEAVPFPKEHILQAILKMPLRTIFLSLGLCWNADSVALAALQAKTDAHMRLQEFTRVEIRFAMRFRGKGGGTHDVILPNAEILEDGMRCFAAWIADVPSDTRQLLVYACENDGFDLPSIESAPMTEREARADLCAEWCEHRMAILAEDVPSDDAEEASTT